MAALLIHEAFAGQVACNLAAWEHGWKEAPIGKTDRDRLNPLGGSIAIGHPFAATGARIIVQSPTRCSGAAQSSVLPASVAQAQPRRRWSWNGRDRARVIAPR
jgi:acetyl-CoA acetyltransferase